MLVGKHTHWCAGGAESSEVYPERSLADITAMQRQTLMRHASSRRTTGLDEDPTFPASEFYPPLSPFVQPASEHPAPSRRSDSVLLHINTGSQSPTATKPPPTGMFTNTARPSVSTRSPTAILEANRTCESSTNRDDADLDNSWFTGQTPSYLPGQTHTYGAVPRTDPTTHVEEAPSQGTRRTTLSGIVSRLWQLPKNMMNQSNDDAARAFDDLPDGLFIQRNSASGQSPPWMHNNSLLNFPNWKASASARSTAADSHSRASLSNLSDFALKQLPLNQLSIESDQEGRVGDSSDSAADQVLQPGVSDATRCNSPRRSPDVVTSALSTSLGALLHTQPPSTSTGVDATAVSLKPIATGVNRVQSDGANVGNVYGLGRGHHYQHGSGPQLYGRHVLSHSNLPALARGASPECVHPDLHMTLPKVETQKMKLFPDTPEGHISEVRYAVPLHCFFCSRNTVRSPPKSFIFIIYKIITWIKASQTLFYCILKTEALFLWRMNVQVFVGYLDAVTVVLA